ncbi:MAG: hypothetical protein WAX07_04630 [Candidatus Altiarchaeia archaeon]
MEKKTIGFMLLVYILAAVLFSGCADKRSGDGSIVRDTQTTIPATTTQITTTSIRETTTTVSTTAGTTTTFLPGCMDSDRRNIYAKGNVSGHSVYSPFDYADVCVNETALLEYYCYSDGAYLSEASEEIFCPGSGKCSEGACVPVKGPLTVPALTGGDYVTGLSDKGFLASYGRYKFRIDGFLYHQDSINGIILDVMRPDGTLVSVQASEIMSGIIASDSLEVFFPGDPARDSGGEKTASIYVRTAIENPPGTDAKLLSGVSDKGFSGGYGDYKFKIDHFIHSKESDIMGVKLYVQRPDGAIISPEVSLDSYAKVDEILVMLPSRHSLESSDEKRADLYVWPSVGGESEIVDLTGIGVAVVNWSNFAPRASSVKYTETGKYETVIMNVFGANVYIESVGARDLTSGQDCELVRVNSLPVDKGSALDVKAGDSFRINAQCPRKSSDERYNIQLQIDYYSFVGGVKKSFSETGEIKGITEL